MQRIGMYWPSMKTHCEEVQRACPSCREWCEPMEVNIVEEDLRKVLKDFLNSGLTPSSPREVEKLKRKAERYFMQEGELFKESFSGNVKCLGKEEQEIVIAETHRGLSGRHQGGRSLWAEILRNGYYWPTMKEYAIDFARRCKSCQMHRNLIHASATSMRGITSPYPFHTWVMDFIGPITPTSKGKKWILVATKHYTRWAEAISTKEAKAEVVANFVKENIVCPFGLPKRIVLDSGTYFINSKVKRVLEKYGIRHDRSTPYYPTVTKHGSTKATPFSLVFGAEAILPTKIFVPSARMAMGDEAGQSEIAELIDGMRDKAEEEAMRHHRRLTLAYVKMVRPRMFHKGELVLKTTDAVMRKQHVSKWAPNWEGPYIVQKAQDSGYFTHIDPKDQHVIGPINFKYVKKYYA
ncbi:Ribonuclease H-like superfamily [Sesbania bispinosa]|nr:Ribonuclease H-like superfamily [Sesbania bispinosa]